MKETEVSYSTEIFQAELQANAPRVQRHMEDMAFYWAIRNGQYSSSAIQALTQQGRPIITFDLISKHVDVEAGMLLQRPFEFHYEAEFGQPDRGAHMANEVRLRDKDLGKWARQDTWFLIDGLINHGVIELFIDYSRPGMELGFLNWRRRWGTDFIFDHSWKTDDINDNKQIAEFQYLDPEAIKWIYGNTAENLDRIEVALEVWKAERAQGKVLQQRGAGFLPWEKNGKFLVIQFMEMPRERKTKLFDPSTGSFLPETFTDRKQREAFLRLSALEGQRYVEIPKTERVCTVKAFAPGLDLNNCLAKGPHRLQVGRYPYVIWSPYRTEDGERFGRVAKYKDPQSVYNKRLATFLHWQMTASNGTIFINPGAFEDDTEENRYMREHNIPGSIFKTVDSDKIKREERPDPPMDLIKVKDDAVEYMNYAGAPLSAQGKTEASGESGVLFDAKREQAAVGMEHMNQGLEHAKLEMGDMYASALSFYHGRPMTFKSAQTKEDVFVNTNPANDLSKIGRLSVRVTMAPVGTSLKRENLAIMAKLRQAAKEPVEASAYGLQIVELLPDVAEDRRSRLKEDMEKVHYRDVLRVDVEILTLQGQIAQMQAAMMIPAQPGNPMGGPAAPGLPGTPDAEFTEVAGGPAAATQPGIPSAGAPIPSPGRESPAGALSHAA